jgi:DNA-binding HxlR family transcriptional regulator
VASLQFQELANVGDEATFASAERTVALAALSDGRPLLIVRDPMLKEERTTYKDFLAAKEGIASNFLADRLPKLKFAGIFTQAPDPNDGRRGRNRLTEAGIDLAPMVVQMISGRQNIAKLRRRQQSSRR